MEMSKVRIEWALISVSDKTGLEELAKQLRERGVSMYSTGGTMNIIESTGAPVVAVEYYTGSPEIMGGRVKTLHPKLHGGILCRRHVQQDLDELAAQGGVLFDLVVVNLYPFEKTVADKDATDEEKVENIDIGGPSMLRSAAKNHRYVTVITSPNEYGNLLSQMDSFNNATTLKFRRECARDAFELTWKYETAIAHYFAQSLSGQ